MVNVYFPSASVIDSVTAISLQSLEFIRVTITAGTGVAVEDDHPDVPGRYVLHNNYPNPFNPATTITFETRERAPLSIAVYDITGRLVTTLLADRTFEAGTHEVTFDACAYPSGTYVAVMQSPEGRQSIVMSLLK